MKKYLHILVFLVTYQITYSHNGKIGYAYPTKSVIIDGKIDDWSKDKWIDIQAFFGKQIENENDLSSRFKVAYNLEEKSLYLLTEIIDNDFTEDDRYEFYINGIHDKVAGGVLSLVFIKDELKLRVHSEEKDPFHSFFNKDLVDYKIRKKKNKWILEAKIILNDFIKVNKSIGIDHFILDVDSDSQEKTYVNWGIGYNGFWKEYNSGQLGDIVLMESRTQKFGEVTGEVKWADETEQEQPKVIDINSIEFKDLWVRVKLDSMGRFSETLPKGNYRISPSYSTTNPFTGDGYGNQLRVDDYYTKYFSIGDMDSISIGKINIPVLGEPSYLFKEEGIIHKTFDKEAQRQLTNFIENQMEYYNVVGASVGVIKDGEIVYLSEFGYRSNLTKKPITNKTHFQAASVTKAVFAFIVNRLVDRGEFDLDTPLYTILPFKNFEEDERYKKITGRIVLNHQSGMGNWPFGGPGGWESGANATLLFEPGSKFGYSGEAFEYLSRVIEKVTGKNLNQLLKDEVIVPLDIPEIYFAGNESIEMAQGHLQGNPTYWFGYNEEPGVAHSMLTNARNFIHFVKALSNQKGLSRKQYDEMFNKTVLAPGYPMSPDNNYWELGMGLGFFVQDTVEGKAVMHGGSNYDFQGEFVLYPESKNGFAIFTNSNTGHKLGQAIGKYLFYGGTIKNKN